MAPARSVGFRALIRSTAGLGVRPDTLERVEPISVSIDKEWLSVGDIARYLEVSDYVVTNLLRTGQIPAVKVGRQWRVARVDFEGWLNRERGLDA